MTSTQKLKVMVPVELGISAQIAAHPQGAVARVIFDYLLVASRLGSYHDEFGFVVVSQVAMRDLGIETKARRRGLHALADLGLVELRRQGHEAYRAKLLYEAPRALRQPHSVGRSNRRGSSRIDDPPENSRNRSARAFAAERDGR